MKKLTVKQQAKNYKLTQQISAKKTQVKKKDPFKERGIDDFIDFRDVRLLTRFLNDQGKLLPARITGATSKMQRKLTVAIKRARHLAFIPFVSDGTKH
ncbi:MAG: 30S ribosomal protein S18 [Bacteroidetes bacterium]|nr:30S ribosomal protein S18 [Bacteroidota bacterium]MBX7046152.1 30S ribosomal protein S18 [Ignavibacteria bacterium]